MSSLAIASIAFACSLAGTIVGMLIARILPAHHLSSDSRDAVKQGLAMIATLTALVLGLLVATTKGTFDTQSAAVREMSANIVLLDRVLELYGPETKEARASLSTALKVMMRQMWPEEDGKAADLAGAQVRKDGEALFDKVAALSPKTDTQTTLKSRALDIIISLGQIRQRLIAQRESTIPSPFLLILGFWLTILFGSYGLLSPRNLTVITVLIVCMLSVSAAIFLVLDLDKPFDGIIRISDAPLRSELSRVNE